MRQKGSGGSLSGGPTLGRYEVIACLGRGGMAQVFLAISRGLGGFSKLIVIKRLDSDELSLRDMFLDEARIAARLNHPNVIDTYEVAQDRGSYFIAMEYLDGQPLNKIVRHMRDTAQVIEPRMCARIIADALAGLHYAHELTDYDGAPLNVVHRDVSPHNLFVTYDGQVKVFDFGVAKAESQLALTTEVGVLKGKIAYMAPEQANGEQVDRRADVFAVGLVLWELLTLQRLMAGDSTVATLRRLLDDPVPTLSDVLPGAAPELDAILRKALARDPDNRFQSALDMRDALLNYLVKTNQSCTQDELNALMHREFERAHKDLQVRIRKCMRAAVKGDAPEEEVNHDDVTLRAAIDSVRGVPILDSGSYGLDDGQDATEPGSRSARGKMATKALPQPAAATLSGQSGRQRRWFPYLVAVVTLLAVLGGWALEKRVAVHPAESRVLQPAPTPEPEILLRLHGSNTIGRELGPALAEGFLRQRGLDQVVHRAGTRPYETVVRGLPPGQGRAQAIEILAEGSSTAFTDLGKHDCDIGMSSRRIKSDEADDLQGKGLGDLTSPASEHVLGLDGIAVIVHPNNPIRSIDLTQLRRVFLGEIKEFAALGGPAGAIHIYARDDQSGTFDTFKHLVLGDGAIAPDARRFVDSESLSDAVAGDVHGIGFIGIVYVRNAKPMAVGEPGSALLFPSTFTVATEDYALARRLYLYTPSQMSTSATMDFVNFALSPEGQKIVKATGFIDLNVGFMNAKGCELGCSARYLELVQNARRLSLDFRFRTGSSELDTRALRDLDRLMLFLRQVATPKLVLLGFSDGRGSPQQNLTLSRERAKKVEEELAARGVRASRVDALGQEMAVASNDSDAGREKNRRVEVWLEEGF